MEVLQVRRLLCSLANIQTSNIPLTHRVSKCIHIIAPWWSLNLKHHQQQRFVMCHPVPALPCATLLTSSSSGGEREAFSHGLSNLLLWWVAAGCFDWTEGICGPTQKDGDPSLAVCDSGPPVWLLVGDKEREHRVGIGTRRWVNVCECVRCLHAAVELCSKANGSWD